MEFIKKQILGAGKRVLRRVFAAGALVAVSLLLMTQLTGSDTKTSELSQGNATASYTFLQNAPGGPAGAFQMHAIGQLPSQEETASDGTVIVSVTVDGQTQEYTIESGRTVAEILDEQQIVCGEYDVVTPKLTQQIKRDREIIVQRVEYTFETCEEIVPCEVTQKESPLLDEGETRVAQKGEDGVRQVTYVTRIVDGAIEGEEEADVIMLAEPVEEIVLVGAPVMVSPIVFEDVELDENGAPLEYTALLTDQIATGYSARKGAKTASGRSAITGHVAVNPNEIPYGSRLYITSEDNSFVYGYAIAADTGVGLKQNIVDVDLFYDTYRESAMNGRKIVNIYVLD